MRPGPVPAGAAARPPRGHDATPRPPRAGSAAAARLARGGAGYPALLERIPDPPAELHVQGDPSALHGPAVAIVGTRRASAEGLQFAELLARDLAARGLVVVSGLAYGIDAAAHRGALRTGRTVAVLASGIDVVTPAGHAALARAVAARGALVSEFAAGAGARAWHFLRRNRVISGLALGTVVVEAGARSGALITARHATEQNREVFAVPGSPLRETSAGPNALLRDGAALVRGWEDVLLELEPRLGEGGLGALASAAAGPLRDSASRAADACVPASRCDADVSGDTAAAAAPVAGALRRGLLAALGRGPMDVDVLCAGCGAEIGAVLAALSALELDGVVRQLPGKRFCRA
jgi:DNA processing protein